MSIDLIGLLVCELGVLICIVKKQQIIVVKCWLIIKVWVQLIKLVKIEGYIIEELFGSVLVMCVCKVVLVVKVLLKIVGCKLGKVVLKYCNLVNFKEIWIGCGKQLCWMVELIVKGNKKLEDFLIKKV